LLIKSHNKFAKFGKITVAKKTTEKKHPQQQDKIIAVSHKLATAAGHQRVPPQRCSGIVLPVVSQSVSHSVRQQLSSSDDDFSRQTLGPTLVSHSQ